MPDIRLKNQPFDLVFHPSEPVLYTSLLTGEVKAFRYDEETGESSSSSGSWTARPSKRTARTLDIEHDSKGLWMGGKGGGLFRIDPATGTIGTEFNPAHESPINRVHCINENLVASGDDEGVIKLWDYRKPEAIRSYSHHFDYISDFTYYEDKRQLVTTSGDGHLSVIDIRSNKPSPMSISEDQEDELLSIVQMKGGSKAVVGSTLGILSVWNRKSGWGDCVDRIPGHPASVDALVALTDDVIATGSEDGMIRVMQILPNKFLGVIATHDDYPIERMKLDHRRKWLGSVSHDECIKLTDIENMLEDSDDEGGDGDEDEDEDMDEADSASAEEEGETAEDGENGSEGEEEEEEDSDSDVDMDDTKQRRGKTGKGGMGDMGRAKAANDDGGFFDDL